MNDLCAALLNAYRQGIFPMADERDGKDVHFYRPVLRALLPIRRLHIPRRLLKTLKAAPYRVSVDTAFQTVIDACAADHPSRPSTWINPVIRNLFIELHRQGHAHSVECWTPDGVFAGGLYGLAIGSVFCGESMVSRADNASKIALVHLCARLARGGFTLLDSQFANDHLKQFGLYEIPQEEYEEKIKIDMNKPADFALAGVRETDLLKSYLAAYSGGIQEPRA